MCFLQVSLTGDNYMPMVKGLHNAIALDYHYKKKLIFWTENNLRVIRAVEINDNNITGKKIKCLTVIKYKTLFSLLFVYIIYTFL